MHDQVIKKIVRIFIAIFITILFATVIALIILRYSVEGEKSMPFELSKIMVISTAEGKDISDIEPTDSRWNLKILQNNDIYLYIARNKNYKSTEVIDEIIIDNLKIIDHPNKGKIKIYKPTANDNTTYENNTENEIYDSLIYKGEEEADVKNLSIANQGGLVLFRYSIEDIGNYITDSDEIKHDGTLLNKIGIETEDLNSRVSFDLTIKLKSGTTYTGTVYANLPAGNVSMEGTSHYELTNISDIIFKRNLR